MGASQTIKYTLQVLLMVLGLLYVREPGFRPIQKFSWELLSLGFILLWAQMLLFAMVWLLEKPIEQIADKMVRKPPDKPWPWIFGSLVFVFGIPWLFSSLVNPFFSSFWPWLTWPMVFTVTSDIPNDYLEFKAIVGPVWRPVFWGAIMFFSFHL